MVLRKSDACLSTWDIVFKGSRSSRSGQGVSQHLETAFLLYGRRTAGGTLKVSAGSSAENVDGQGTGSTFPAAVAADARTKSSSA